MFKRIGLACALVSSLSAAKVASADPITWFASDLVTGANSTFEHLLPPIGTPWSMTATFDPDAVGQPLNFAAPPGCNRYPLMAATFTIGGARYTNPGGGLIMTEAGFPDFGCDPVFNPDGLTQFVFGIGETTDPTPWDLTNMFVVADYWDASISDGSLPRTPGNPAGPTFAAMYDPQQFMLALGNPEFRVVEQPTPVPEPATMTLFGAGLAAVIARRRRLAAGSRKP